MDALVTLVNRCYWNVGFVLAVVEMMTRNQNLRNASLEGVPPVVIQLEM